jgi:hypothetical protein
VTRGSRRNKRTREEEKKENNIKDGRREEGNKRG